MCKVTSQHASRAYQFHQCLSMAEKVCSLSSHAHKLAIWLLTGHLTGQADFSHHCQGSFFPLISDRDLFFLVNNIFVFTHVTHGHCRSYGERKVQRSEPNCPSIRAFGSHWPTWGKTTEVPIPQRTLLPPAGLLALNAGLGLPTL